MEQNQNPNQSNSLFELNIDANANMTLRSAATWARVLGIVSLIMGIFFVIFGVIWQNTIKSSGSGYSSAYGSIMRTSGLVYFLVIGIVMIISAIFALNFASRISTAVKANDQVSLSMGLGAVRNYFAFWSVICIIFLLLLLLGIMGSLSR